MRTGDGIEAWDLNKDRRLFTAPLSQLDRVLADPGGCVTLSEGRVNLFSRSSSFRELATGATAISEHSGEILVATGREILVFDRAGNRTSKYPADVRVAAMLRIGDRLVVGYKEGTIDLIALRRGVKRTSLSLEAVPSSSVVRLLPGPMGTLSIGFANGLVGLWDVKNGSRLFSAQLHGPVAHMVLREGTLHAASELGDYKAIDLSAFEVDYCKMLRAVWRKVTVVWEGGLAVRRPPPANHRCAPSK
jgi:hypothetical protein